jgi:hypothetical protein
MKEPFPSVISVFRQDRKQTWGDVIDNNPEDRKEYIRKDLYDELKEKLAQRLWGGWCE